jgi:hypothetical protein
MVWWVAVGLLVVGLLSGCSSGSGSAMTGPSAPSSSQAQGGRSDANTASNTGTANHM